MGKKTKLRAVLYLRVSTKDGRQDTANQRRQLEQLAKERDYEIVKVYTDRKSGKNSDRKAFQAMLRDAKLDIYDIVLFWAMDRFSRAGTLDTLTHLQRLREIDIQFLSYTESFLDSCGMMKDVMIAMLATFAQHERQRLSDRTKAALDRKREDFEAGNGVPGPNGYILGGRPEHPFDLKLAKRMFQEGYSFRAIADYMGIASHTSVRTKLAKAGVTSASARTQSV